MYTVDILENPGKKYKVPIIRIAVAEGAVADQDWIMPLAKELGCELVFGPINTVDQFVNTTAGCDGLIVSLHQITSEQLARKPESLRALGRAGVGLDSIDLPACESHKVSVIFQPVYALEEVANHALSMILALHRGLFSADKMVRDFTWGPALKVAEITSLQDATVGVIGCGRIGQNVIRKLQPFVKQVLGYDVNIQGPIDGVTMVDSLDELLTRSKIVTLHTPLLPSTRHMIDAEALAKMPKGAILVNVSRGGLVDEKALGLALESGHISAAGLDVFETEPLGEDSALRQVRNLILSPHIAWYSKSSGPRLGQWTLIDLFLHLSSNPIKNGAFATGPF